MCNAVSAVLTHNIRNSTTINCVERRSGGAPVECCETKDIYKI